MPGSTAGRQDAYIRATIFDACSRKHGIHHSNYFLSTPVLVRKLLVDFRPARYLPYFIKHEYAFLIHTGVDEFSDGIPLLFNPETVPERKYVCKSIMRRKIRFTQAFEQHIQHGPTEVFRSFSFYNLLNALSNFTQLREHFAQGSVYTTHTDWNHPGTEPSS